jgi:ATP-dependent Lon protease
MVFVGNLNQPVEVLVQNSATDLFQPLPPDFDLAVIDRLHFYMPGWEVPKTSKDLLTERYGFVTDYLAEAGRRAYLKNFITTTFHSFWGQFGWMAVPMSERVYLALTLLTWHVRRL